MKAGSTVVDVVPEDAKTALGLAEEVDRVCGTEERAVDIDAEVEMAELIPVLVRRLVMALGTAVRSRVAVVVETGMVDEAEAECIRVLEFARLLVDKEEHLDEVADGVETAGVLVIDT